MIKRLRILKRPAQVLLVGILLVVLGAGWWLQSAVHSLEFAKPWLLKNLNPPDVPYEIGFEDITIDWQEMTEFGKLRIRNIALAKRSGEIFAKLPEVFVTLDPLGFLPGRTLLRSIILRNPRLILSRDETGTVFIGLNDEDAPLPLPILLSSLRGDTEASTTELTETSEAVLNQTASEPISLPFHKLLLTHARLTLKDDRAHVALESTDAGLHITHDRGHYQARLSLPFTYHDQKGSLTANLTPKIDRDDYQLESKFTQLPAALVCSFAPCPEDATLDGLFAGTLRLGLHENGALGDAWASITTRQATLTAAKWFVGPIQLTDSAVIAGYDSTTHTIMLEQARLGLEDTLITAHARAEQKSDGWYVTGQGETTRLDVDKVYKYWPLFMAPDSREWVTSKLKAGYAAKGSITLNLTPADFAADVISDDAMAADVDARDITFEYLPGFPWIHHMDGDVHFTGTTVKILGKNGTMLDGSKISKAILFCPNLNHPHNPMEATISATMPAPDLITLLTQKPFTFDDSWGLVAAKATGTASADMVLKFDSFSGKTSADPNEIHLEAVDYNIKGTLTDFSQSGLLGGQDVRGLSGTLVTSTATTEFTGNLRLGASSLHALTLHYADKKPLTLTVKSLAEPKAPPGNDFELSYDKNDGVKHYTLRGKRLDTSLGQSASANTEGSLLTDFPSLKLEVTLDELQLTAAAPLRNVNATLDCGSGRCESANLSASLGKGTLHANIARIHGVRELTATASNAGELLRDLNITDRMQNGKLELRGKYDDRSSPAPLNGRLIITDFTLQNAQILGRILSIGSLSGLSNALTGSGIAFDKLSTDFSTKHGVFTLSEGKANGTAMGITVNGTIDTDRHRFGLKGVLVPAYALNSILGKIPIIGMLAGGEDEGLIAFNYAVEGTFDTPDVSVNPLSGLTPGFLRGIFGVFDAPEAKQPATEKWIKPDTPTNHPQKIIPPSETKKPKKKA